MEVINTNINNEHKSMNSTDMSNGNTTDSSNERKRKTKKEKYALEREKFTNQIYNISGFDKNEFISIRELENNEILKNFLLNNITLIKKYWKAGLWSYFTNKQNNDIITLFRTLMNNSNYNLYSKQKVLVLNGEKKDILSII